MAAAGASAATSSDSDNARARCEGDCGGYDGRAAARLDRDPDSRRPCTIVCAACGAASSSGEPERDLVMALVSATAFEPLLSALATLVVSFSCGPLRPPVERSAAGRA